MKEYAIAVVIATMVVTIFAEDHPITPIPTSCPATDSEDYTVHIAHESDCTKFYKCQQGKAIEMSCPYMNKQKTKRLHFNALYQVCDWPTSAGCEFTTIPAEKPTPPLNPGNGSLTCDDAEEGAAIPHNTRCYLFYECTEGESVLRECPENTNYDPIAQRCLPLDQSNCKLTDPCRNYRREEGTFLADPTSCKHVYYCKGRQTTRYECDEGAEWSVQDAKCLPREDADCVRRRDYW
ncbi:hypothetical protein KPH14_001628 [Odynerus spinipes]|uniref:Chitin-binding type-2 domain-containing protein n=1 Tax=Odynerus spinipes TaxID=1348599 RepID=A0AAD9S121_9HYME|nr:hypothetical protein KPH14_001628 [Odynerus spinipes]